MHSPRFMLPVLSLMICLGGVSGCGTTRLTDTARSASEEMLLSHSIDRSVGQLNLEVLAGQSVFLDTSNLGDVNFRGYLTGALRQHLLACGARLVCRREQAEIVVEARAGSVATTRHDSLVGFPQTTVPAILFGSPATLPEVAIRKKSIHIGVAKVGVFAYRTDNGAGVWQSGIQENQSTSESNWYLGVGPFHTGDVVLDGQRGNNAGLSQPRPRRQSPLEHEYWVGELPPVKPWHPADQRPRVEGERDTHGTPEEISPGLPEPLPEDPWQLISPVLIDP